MTILHKWLAIGAAALAGAGATPLAAGVEASARPAPDADAVRLVVDLSDRELYVLRGGEVERTYAVAVGKPEHPTPKGEFGIRRIIWNPRWVPPDASWARGKKPRAAGDPQNPMGRVKMFFKEPDYYVHGTHQEDSLGRAESHGCIRMRNDDVIDLAKVVMQSGGEHREPGWFRRVINRVTQTQDVRLSQPVSFEVRA
ncbi:MAG TPA: L,D-transpeptidase [Longimicrobiaceae bacterium]|nr:L,D-transpeptidase [Longimicrobiaceae bacterium]